MSTTQLARTTFRTLRTNRAHRRGAWRETSRPSEIALAATHTHRFIKDY